MVSVKVGMRSSPGRVTWKWFIAPASSMYLSVTSRKRTWLAPCSWATWPAMSEAA